MCVRAEISEAGGGAPKASSLELHVAWREIRMREFMRMQMRYAQEHAPIDVTVFWRFQSATLRKTPSPKRTVHVRVDKGDIFYRSTALPDKGHVEQSQRMFRRIIKRGCKSNTSPIVEEARIPAHLRRSAASPEVVDAENGAELASALQLI